MAQTELEEQIAGLAALSDPTRRRLYFFIASRLEGAGREEAAEAAAGSPVPSQLFTSTASSRTSCWWRSTAG